MSLDPAITNADHYTVVFENERVRVLEYSDQPGDQTTQHEHPDSIMYTLGSFRRRLILGDRHREVELQAGQVVWLPAQQHRGENIGETPSHSIFIELKEPRPGTVAQTGDASDGGPPEALGPVSP